MKPKIDNWGERPTEEDIVNIEKGLNITLPKGYRQFLLENNGGEPIPECFYINDDLCGSILRMFYKYENIVGYTFSYRKGYPDESGDTSLMIPEDMIPIAEDIGENPILLGVGKENYNKVFQLDYSNQTFPEGWDLSKPFIYLKANSFEELINSFCTQEEFDELVNA